MVLLLVWRVLFSRAFKMGPGAGIMSFGKHRARLVVDDAKKVTFDYFFFASRGRHTISLCDWSSDVCSSDLRHRLGLEPRRRRHLGSARRAPDADPFERGRRSEERRVGREWRSRGAPEH